MSLFIVILVILILFAGLIALGARSQTEGMTNSQLDSSGLALTVDQNFLDKDLWKEQIPNAIPGPGTDFVGRVIYSSADLEAGIVKNRNEIANLRQNLPGDIASAVEQQESAICGGVRRLTGRSAAYVS
jgi:hypothetical protein